MAEAATQETPQNTLVQERMETLQKSRELVFSQAATQMHAILEDFRHRDIQLCALVNEYRVNVLGISCADPTENKVNDLERRVFGDVGWKVNLNIATEKSDPVKIETQEAVTTGEWRPHPRAFTGPVTLRAAAETVCRESKRPLRGSEIAELVAAGGYRLDQKTTQKRLGVYLMRKPFKRVKRGIYTVIG